MDEEEIQYDVYFQGAKEDLYALLFPLTGPHSSIFEHLDLQTITRSNHSLAFNYSTKNFTNLDSHNTNTAYKTMAIPTNSNYFYSKQIPGQKAFVWRNVCRMMELRPSVENGKMKEDNKEEEIELIKEEDLNNKIIKQMNSVTEMPLNRNWNVSKQEYLNKFCE